jgi:hypothetical protein
MTSEQSQLVYKAALHYAEQGIYIFPVYLTQGADGKWSKKPAIDEWPAEATIDPAWIEKWFHPESGLHREAAIGLACGLSGIVVVDCDIKNNVNGISNWETLRQALNIPATQVQRTPSGGLHYFYNADPEVYIKSTTGIIAQGVDTRGDGGFVVLAPSQGYTFTEGEPDWTSLPKVPDIVKSKVGKKDTDDTDKSTQVPVGQDPGNDFLMNRVRYRSKDFFVNKVRERLVRLAETKEGSRRNETMYTAIYLNHYTPAFCSQNSLAADITQAAQLNGLPADEIKQAIREGFKFVDWKAYVRPEQPARNLVSLNGSAPPPPQLTKGLNVGFTPANSIKLRITNWLWDGRIPIGELTLTPGRGGIGKSTWHAWLMACITRGILPGMYYGTPKACAVAAAEDSWERTIAPRLYAAGADLSRVYRIDVFQEADTQISLTLPLHLNYLAEQMREVDAVLLDCDPLMSVIADSLDTYKDKEIRSALEPIARAANKENFAVVGNAHFTKQGRDPHSAVMGGAAFYNVSRAVVSFVRDDISNDGKIVVSQLKNNLGTLDLPHLKYQIISEEVPTDEGPTSVGKLIWDAQFSQYSGQQIMSRSNGDNSHNIKEAEDARARHEWLRKLLKDGDMSVKEIRAAGQAFGYTPDQLRRSKDYLRIEPHHKPGVLRGPWYWSLPDDDVPEVF